MHTCRLRPTVLDAWAACCALPWTLVSTTRKYKEGATQVPQEAEGQPTGGWGRGTGTGSCAGGRPALLPVTLTCLPSDLTGCTSGLTVTFWALSLWVRTLLTSQAGGALAPSRRPGRGQPCSRQRQRAHASSPPSFQSRTPLSWMFTALGPGRHDLQKTPRPRACGLAECLLAHPCREQQPVYHSGPILPATPFLEMTSMSNLQGWAFLLEVGTQPTAAPRPCPCSPHRPLPPPPASPQGKCSCWMNPHPSQPPPSPTPRRGPDNLLAAQPSPPQPCPRAPELPTPVLLHLRSSLLTYHTCLRPEICQVPSMTRLQHSRACVTRKTFGFGLPLGCCLDGVGPAAGAWAPTAPLSL